MTIYFVVFFCLQKPVFCSLYQENDFPVRYCVIVEKSLKLNTGKSVEKQYFVIMLFRASYLVFRMMCMFLFYSLCLLQYVMVSRLLFHLAMVPLLPQVGTSSSF